MKSPFVLYLQIKLLIWGKSLKILEKSGNFRQMLFIIFGETVYILLKRMKFLVKETKL